MPRAKAFFPDDMGCAGESWHDHPSGNACLADALAMTFGVRVAMPAPRPISEREIWPGDGPNLNWML